MLPRLTIFFACIALAACVPNVHERTYPAQAVVLPQDDAAHAAPLEWWYYTGHVQDEEGREYGFKLTFFKAYAPPQWTLLGFLPAYWLFERGHVAHFAVTDLGRDHFVMAERADYWGHSAGASREDLKVHLANWRAERAGDGVSHHLRAGTQGYRIDLTLTPLKPAALHGNPPGIQTAGPEGVFYYVSYTRMNVEGTLYIDGRALQVTGQAWHDHQWGDMLLEGFAGWDWFSLQFDDNTELMFYLIRAPSGDYLTSMGSFITADGRTVTLYAEDFEVVHLGDTWTSSQTAAIYPLGWQVRVPAWDVDVTVTPRKLEQEMDTRASTGVVYWEGKVAASGSHEGVGYVELTNYDLYPYGKTDETTPLRPLRRPVGL